MCRLGRTRGRRASRAKWEAHLQRARARECARELIRQTSRGAASRGTPAGLAHAQQDATPPRLCVAPPQPPRYGRPLDGPAPGATTVVRARALAAAAILVAVVGLLYARVLRAPFVWDDGPAIVDNPSITRLWPLIGDAAYRGPLYPPPLAPTARRAFANLTLALNYRAGGLDPTGYHVVNVALHALTAVLLAVLASRLLRRPAFGGVDADGARALGLAIALVWAVHPLATEAVAYVTQRTELLGTCAYVATLVAVRGSWDAAGAARIAGGVLAPLACAVGMTSKELAASAPLAVLLLDVTLTGASWRTAVRRSWPLYAALAATWGLLVVQMVAWGSSGGSDSRHHVSLLAWWLTQSRVLLLYLRLAVWPWPLSFHYPPTYLDLAAAWPFVLALVALVATTWALVRRRPAARFVVAVVVLGIAVTLPYPLPKMVAAERRTYLPLAGLVALAIAGVDRLLEGRRRAVLVGCAVWAIVLGATTFHRLAAYESPVTLWQDAVLRQPDDAMSHYNLGVALLDAHRPAEALPHFERTVALEPDHGQALDNLGAALNALGRPQDAIAPLEAALRLDPQDGFAHLNLTAALLKTGRPPAAREHLDRAVALLQDEPAFDVQLNLARALLETGRADEALGHVERALRLRPDDGDARLVLGTCLLRLGRPGDAVAQLERAVAAKPDDVDGLNNLGGARIATGDAPGAVVLFRRIAALRPDDARVEGNLGAALLQVDRTEEAIAHLQRAIALQPGYATARFNLATALSNLGRAHEAIPHFDALVRAEPDDARLRFGRAVAYARDDRRTDAVAMAREARDLAVARRDDALVAEIDGWLAR